MDASCAYTLPDNMAPLVGTVYVNKLIERYASVHTFATDYSSLSTASPILRETANHYILNLGMMSRSCSLYLL
jgi:hypothetical protein